MCGRGMLPAASLAVERRRVGGVFFGTSYHVVPIFFREVVEVGGEEVLGEVAHHFIVVVHFNTPFVLF